MKKINKYYLVRVEFETTDNSEEEELTQEGLNKAIWFEENFALTFGYGNVKLLSKWNQEHVTAIKSAFGTDQI